MLAWLTWVRIPNPASISASLQESHFLLLGLHLLCSHLGLLWTTQSAERNHRGLSTQHAYQLLWLTLRRADITTQSLCARRRTRSHPIFTMA